MPPQFPDTPKPAEGSFDETERCIRKEFPGTMGCSALAPRALAKRAIWPGESTAQASLDWIEPMLVAAGNMDNTKERA
jgi:hypothetical protein